MARHIQVESKEKHPEAQDYIHRVVQELKRQAAGRLRLQLDQITLEEWSTHRANLANCSRPVNHYGSDEVHKVFDEAKHTALIMAMNDLIIELKVRAKDHPDILVITPHMLEEIDRQAAALSQCREPVRFE